MSKTDDGIRCTSGTSSEIIQGVSSSFAPNTIDFSSVFSKFDINAQGAVLGVLLAVFFSCLLAMAYGHYKDRKTLLEVRISLL